MKQKNARKVLMVAGVIAVSLCLTGCYIPPDEISDGTQNMTVGSNSFPFDTVRLSTDTPTPTPTNTPTASPTYINNSGTINNPWASDDWSTTNQPQPTNNWGNIGTQTGAITTTTRPTDTPTPTNTPAPTSLRVGASGTDVRALQQRLKDLGYYKGSVDGDFGVNTENAVKAFQAQCGLTADGIVGNYTKSRLNSSSAPTAPRATNTPKPTVKVTTKPTNRPTQAPSYDEDTYLQVGSSGKDVRQLQERLIALGWMDGKADSYYGGATEYAVKAFQNRAGLWNDGVAGPDTLKKLYSSSAPSTSTTQSSIGESLKEGMEGKAVRALQTRLKSLGYLSGSVDGSFGAATKTAVTSFQKQHGLTADGVAGTATLNKIYSDSAKKYSGGSSSSNNGGGSSGNNNGGSSSGNGNSHSGSSGKVDTSDITSTGYITLREGDKSDAVTQLQRRLKNLGFYTGHVDGSYGSGTTAAVKAYQASKNLEADGVAGPATQRALYGVSSTQTYATLRPGDEGSGVKNMQYTLYELGYYQDDIDGIYGDTTADAVRAFQIANDLDPVDGIAGNKTLQTLYSEDPVAFTEPTVEYKTLRPGEKGLAVIEMQEALYQLGYLADISGKYDSATEAAVMNFQKYNGLTADGVAGNQTLKKLYSNSAKAYPGR